MAKRSVSGDSGSILGEPEFVRRELLPMVLERMGAPDGAVLKLMGRGGYTRGTAEYRLVGDGSHDGERFYAKLYADAGEGRSSYQILRGLWEGGLGPGSPHRVTEPLGYLPEHRVLLMRTAPGEPLEALEGRDPERWEEGVRDAARWLARLHAAPTRLGPSEDIAPGVFRLVRRVARTTARHPDTEGLTVRLMDELARRAGTVNGDRPKAQTHGRYHAGHVFLSPEGVTVIDPDRASLADPAKDVTEFVHRLRWKGLKAGADRESAERSARTFVEEYAGHHPDNLANAGYYWSYAVLFTLLRQLQKREASASWQERMDALQEEFFNVPPYLSAHTAAS